MGSALAHHELRPGRLRHDAALGDSTLPKAHVRGCGRSSGKRAALAYACRRWTLAHRWLDIRHALARTGARVPFMVGGHL